MQYAQSLSAVKEAFQKHTNADAPNMAMEVAKFADLHGTTKSKIDALEATLDRGMYLDENTLQRGFGCCFKHNNRIVRLSGYDENVEGASYEDGVFWEYEDVRLKMSVVRYNGSTVEQVDGSRVVLQVHAAEEENTHRALAKQIVEMLEYEEFCELCGQALDGTPGPVCRSCGMTEMDEPCRTCKRKIGRGIIGVFEHPCCKRRRLE